MRQVLFRIAAGFLAIAFFFVAITSNEIKDWRLWKQFGLWVITITFAIFAIAGSPAAEKFLSTFFGFGNGKDDRS